MYVLMACLKMNVVMFDFFLSFFYGNTISNITAEINTNQLQFSEK